MSSTNSIIVKYGLYALGIIMYLTFLQFLMASGFINANALMVLFVPLLVVAYFFNIPLKKKRRTIAADETMLSQRELELAQLVAEGKPNKEIAGLLFISENTVKTHIKNILAKLSLKNRTQIAQWYYENCGHPKE